MKTVTRFQKITDNISSADRYIEKVLSPVHNDQEQPTIGEIWWKSDKNLLSLQMIKVNSDDEVANVTEAREQKRNHIKFVFGINKYRATSTLIEINCKTGRFKFVEEIVNNKIIYSSKSIKANHIIFNDDLHTEIELKSAK